MPIDALVKLTVVDWFVVGVLTAWLPSGHVYA